MTVVFPGESSKRDHEIPTFAWILLGLALFGALIGFFLSTERSLFFFSEADENRTYAGGGTSGFRFHC